MDDQTHSAELTSEQLSALAGIPAAWADPHPAWLGKLPKPTHKDAEKGHCNECGGWHGLPAIHVPFMGHGHVTHALTLIDPGWTWRPAAIDPATGGPAITKRGRVWLMWGYLTVHGKTLPGVGSCEDKVEVEKELIGDFIRNAALRFGVGVSLWSKTDANDAPTEPRARRTSTAKTGGLPPAQPPELDDAGKARLKSLRESSFRPGVLLVTARRVAVATERPQPTTLEALAGDAALVEATLDALAGRSETAS